MNSNQSAWLALALVGVACVALVAAPGVAAALGEDAPQGDASGYILCTVNDAPTFVVPDAVGGLHIDESGTLLASDTAGTSYAYRLRPGDACTHTRTGDTGRAQ